MHASDGNEHEYTLPNSIVTLGQRSLGRDGSAFSALHTVAWQSEAHGLSKAEIGGTGNACSLVSVYRFRVNASEETGVLYLRLGSPRRWLLLLDDSSIAHPSQGHTIWS